MKFFSRKSSGSCLCSLGFWERIVWLAEAFNSKLQRWTKKNLVWPWPRLKSFLGKVLSDFYPGYIMILSTLIIIFWPRPISGKEGKNPVGEITKESL